MLPGKNNEAGTTWMPASSLVSRCLYASVEGPHAYCTSLPSATSVMLG